MKNEYVLTPKHDYTIFIMVCSVVKFLSMELLLKVVLNYCNVQYINNILLAKYLTNYTIPKNYLLFWYYIGFFIAIIIVFITMKKVHYQHALEGLSVILFAYTSFQSLFIIPQINLIISIITTYEVIFVSGCMITLYIIKYFYLNLYYQSRNILKIKPKLMCIIDIGLDLALLLSSENKTIQTDIYIAVVVVISTLVILMFNTHIYGKQIIQSILTFQVMYYAFILIIAILSIWSGIAKDTYLALLYILLAIGSISYFFGFYYFQRKHIVNVTRNMHYLIHLNFSIKELLQSEKISINNDYSLSNNETLSLNNEENDKQTYQQQFTSLYERLKQVTRQEYSEVYYQLMTAHLVKNNISPSNIKFFQMINLPIEDTPIGGTMMNQVYTIQQIDIFLKNTKIQPHHILNTIIYLCYLENKKSLHDQYYLAQQLGIKTLLQFDVGKMNQYEVQQFKKFLTRQLQYFILQLIEILYYLDPAKYYMTYAVTTFQYYIKEPELLLLSQNIANFENVPQVDAEKANINYQFTQKAEKTFKVQYYDYCAQPQQMATLSLLTTNQLNQNIKYMQFLKKFIENIVQPNMTKYESKKQLIPAQEEQIQTMYQCMKNYSTIETMLEPLIINRQLEYHEPYIEYIQLIIGNIGLIINLIENYNDYLEAFCSTIDVKKLYDVIENKFHDISNYLVLYDYKVQSFLTQQKQNEINEYMKITKNSLKNVVEKLEIKIKMQNSEYLQKYNNYYIVMKQMITMCQKFDQVFQEIFAEQQKFQNVQYASTQNNNQNTSLYVFLLQRLIEQSLTLPENLIQLVEIFTRCDANLQKYNQVFTRFYLQDISYNIFSKFNTQITYNNQQIISINNIDYTYHLEKYTKIKHYGERQMLKLADLLFKFQYSVYYTLQQNMLKQKHSQSFNIAKMRTALNNMIQSYFKLYKNDPSIDNLNKLRQIIRLVYIAPNQDKQLVYQKGSILQYNKNDYTDFNEVTNLFNVYNIIYGLKPDQIQVIINNWDLIPNSYYRKVIKSENDNQQQNSFITLINQSAKHLDVSSENNTQPEDASHTQDNLDELVIYVDKTTHQYAQIGQSDTIGQYDIIPYNKYLHIPDTGNVKLQINRRNKFDPKNQFYLHKIREQLYPSNRLYKFLDGPSALYDFKDVSNLQHFKHLNININSDIQALLQSQNFMNQHICKFISVLLLTLLIIGNYAMHYFEMRTTIRETAINMFSNTFVLQNVDLQHHILYNQKFINKNDTLPFKEFVPLHMTNTYYYNKNIESYQNIYRKVEQQIQQQLIYASQQDNSLIQYLQHIEYKCISFLSYLFNVIKPQEFPKIDAQLINRTEIINGLKYDKLSSITQDFNYIVQQLQYIIQPDIYYSSQIGLYNQYTGSQIIKLLVIAFQQGVLFKYNVIPQSAQFLTYNRTQFLNSELYKLKLQETEIEILQGQRDYNMFYIGSLYKKQYTQFNYYDKAQSYFYYSSLFNKTEYSRNKDSEILYEINMSNSSLIIIILSAILILLALLAFVGGSIMMFNKHINQVLNEIEIQFNRNYLEYIGKDVLKNQIYLQTDVRAKYITYINNLIQHKVSIISFKQSFIKYFKIEKKQKYYQPVLSKYCINQKETLFAQKYKFLQQFFFILIMIWFSLNVLQSVSMQIAITNKTPEFDAKKQDYIKAISSLASQFLKFELFGRQRDVDGIIYQLLQIYDNNDYYLFPTLNYHFKYLFAYGYEIQCNVSYNQTFSKLYETLKLQQENLPVPDDDEITSQYCSRLLKIARQIADYDQSLFDEAINDLNTQIVKRGKIFNTIHPNQDFNSYYKSLTDFNEILFYHLITPKIGNFIQLTSDIQEYVTKDITQYNAECSINQALSYNRVIDTVTNQILYVVVLLTIYLIKYYKIRKMELTKKNALHNLLVIGVSIVLISIQAVFAIQIIYQKKCKNLKYNTSAQELIQMTSQLTKKIYLNNFDNYNPLNMSYYTNIQKNFISNTFRGQFTVDEIREIQNSKILGTIALTNKDFYNFSLYNKVDPQNLITGYYNEDKTFMEYLTIMGQLSVSSQQDLIENVNELAQILDMSQRQYIFFAFYQLLFFVIGLFYFYIIFYGIKPEKNRAQQINIIVKPYITLYLTQINQQNYKLIEAKQYYKINNKMYSGHFFDEIQNKLDKLINKYIDGLITGKELIIDRPNYVACCVYDEQQKCYYMVPAEDQLPIPDNLCQHCVENMLARRIQRKSSLKKVNISSNVYIHYLIVMVLLISYFVYVISIVIAKYVQQNKIIKQLTSLNMHLTKLSEIIYDYNIQKIQCKQTTDFYFKHYQLYMKFQKYENFWVQNNIILNHAVVDFPRLYKLLNIMKNQLFTCQLYDTSQLIQSINNFVQSNIPKQNQYIYSLNIYLYIFVILIIGIKLKLTLWHTFDEMHFIDTLYGFCTKGRPSLQNNIVR